MLKVLPIQSKEEQEKICALCGVEYNPDLLAYSAESDGKLAGVSQFKLTNAGGIIYDIAPAKDFESFEALVVMGRGTLNFIDLCGIHRAEYRGDRCRGRTHCKNYRVKLFAQTQFEGVFAFLKRRG